MFRTVPLSIIKSLCTVRSAVYMSYSFVDSFRAGRGWSTDLYDIYIAERTVNKLLMMDRGAARNM